MSINKERGPKEPNPVPNVHMSIYTLLFSLTIFPPPTSQRYISHIYPGNASMLSWLAQSLPNTFPFPHGPTSRAFAKATHFMRMISTSAVILVSPPRCPLSIASLIMYGRIGLRQNPCIFPKWLKMVIRHFLPIRVSSLPALTTARPKKLRTDVGNVHCAS